MEVHNMTDIEKLLKNVSTEELEKVLKSKEQTLFAPEDRINSAYIGKANTIIKQNRILAGNSKAYRVCGSCGAYNIVDNLEVK
jgi:hypothetical protein